MENTIHNEQRKLRLSIIDLEEQIEEARARGDYRTSHYLELKLMEKSEQVIDY